MIERLTSSAFFPVSGATLRADYQPKSGITAVVGENGAGKTFLSIETVRWLLYGKAALRGAAGDYKDANASGCFLIRGARYEISRGKAEWVKDASGSMVAKGAEKVTEFVTEAMGYGLDVFDLCNAATQGNVQKLGDMRPAERKAIIDKVLRLTDAEKAEKDCRTEATGYKREAEALAKALRAPGDEPVTPAGYMPSESLRGALTAMRATRDAHAALRGQLRLVDAPVRPLAAAFSEDAIADLEQHERDRAVAQAEHRRLDSITQRCRPYSPDKYSEDQLQVAERRNLIRHALDQRGPAPQLTAAASERIWAQWALFDAHQPSDEIECPKCAHKFRTTGEPPTPPLMSKEQLREDDARRSRHCAPAPVLPDGPDLTPQKIKLVRDSAAADAEHDAAYAALRQLVIPDDRSAELTRMRNDKATMDAFLAEQLRYERVRQSNAEIEAQIAALDPDLGQDIIDNQAEGVHRAEMYEAAYATWQRDDAAFKAAQAKIADASYLAEEYALGAKGISDARAVVKALIAPKISRIATVLIRDMSMGKLDNLIVDDEMEITVGGQRIETLSGAGKTVANLALRVAMGQALVGHVFPVFLADEIDGDLSATRRAATLQALVSLKKHLSQIILVTHRGAEIADHVWDVESTG